MASRRILRGMDDAVLVAGTNLPTLLDFVFAEGRRRRRRRATRRSADARRSPCTEPARDARAVSHRRSADSRSGRRRLGTAARYRLHRARRRRGRRRAIGSRSSIAWACRRRWMSTSTPRRTRSPRCPKYRADPRPGMLLTGDIATMRRLVDDARRRHGERRRHPFARRTRRSACATSSSRPTRSSALRELAARGAAVTAQDVPGARPVSLDDLLAGNEP